MSPDLHDYSNLSDEALERALALLKIDLNAAYGKFATVEQAKFVELCARVDAIRAEQKRRKT
ncbi:hypothetical protein EN759_00460 [Mesorhizobium sp. M00.F.Ca.ET.038.03.1.1]|nr:hypothetical protein EN759_00460 [Mesorhizobium sp. M00.F.Ca.ET.038.03.1.1]TIW04535.1 MAG: hypothetical protein E5V77_00180 [Mesorhizobium sp.]